MTGSWALDPQPTARETRDIVFRLGHELAVRGARVHHDIIGGFRFRMPLLRETKHGGSLHAIFSGRVTIGAGLGEPWRVRYELRFTLLTIIAFLLSAGLVTIGIHWPRGRLLDLLGLLWIVAYGIPCLRAIRTFRDLVKEAVRETVSDNGATEQPKDRAIEQANKRAIEQSSNRTTLRAGRGDQEPA